MSEAVSRARAFALDDGRTVVPEPDVKAALAGLGVTVPDSVTGSPTDLAEAVTGLGMPVVLKAFGPGLVHKSDAGAVALGLTHGELGSAIRAMTEHLEAQSITPSGFLVEEQCQAEGSLEVIVGVVRREPFGLVVALGLGGTMTEVLDLVAVRMFPLHEHDARELVDTFPWCCRSRRRSQGQAAPTASGWCGCCSAVGGERGLAAQLGDELSELECNPVLVAPSGAIALDARLVLRYKRPGRDSAARDGFHRVVLTAWQSPSPVRRRHVRRSGTARSRRTGMPTGASISTRSTRKPTPSMACPRSPTSARCRSRSTTSSWACPRRGART